jgi:hypothetical protein
VKPLVPLAALLCALAVIVSACGQSTSPSPAASAPPSPGASASEPGVAPSPSASTSGSAAATVAPSGLALPHEDPELEAELPDEVDGVTLFKLSVGPIASAGNTGAEAIRDLADEIGDGSGNFGLAFANDPSSGAYNLFALRVPGASTDELLEQYTGLTVADTRGAETDQLTLAGKTVVHVTAPGNPIGDVWFYAVGDTLYGVQAGSEADAEKLLALLP